MEQGFPPPWSLPAEPIDWFLLAGLVVICGWVSLRLRWNFRSAALGWIVGFCVILLIVLWIDGYFIELRRRAPGWVMFVRAVLLLVVPATLAGTCLDMIPTSRLRWPCRFIPPLSSILFVFCFLASHVQRGIPPEVARRWVCRDNLQHISIGLHNYYDAFERLPATSTGDPPVSWRVALLPYLKRDGLSVPYDASRSWDQSPNMELLTIKPEVYVCPSNMRPHDNVGRYFTSYVGPTGPHTFLGSDGVRRFRDIRDGTSNTIAVVEACGLEILWTDPRDFDVIRGPIGINLKGHGRSDSPGVMSSWHRTGVQVVFGDGAVRFLSDKTDPAVLNALLTADGGDDPGEDW